MAFPTRLLRSALGPLLEDYRPVRSPRYETGAARLNALEQTATGAGLTVCRAYVVAGYSGGVLSVVDANEAWNTDGTQVRPSLSRVSAGVYEWDFDTTYVDHLGIANELTLYGALATPLVAAETFAERIVHQQWIDAEDPSIVQVRFWSAAGADYDPARFLVGAW